MGLFSLAGSGMKGNLKAGCGIVRVSGKREVGYLHGETREFLSFWGGKRDGRPPTPEMVAT